MHCARLVPRAGLLLALLQAQVAGAERTPPPQPGPFELRSRDGKSSVAPGLTVQLRTQVDSRDATSGVRELAATVEARRIRPTLSGTLLTLDLRYYFQLSTAPGSLEFMDLYLDYRLARWLQLRAGQWKIPFTRYRIGSYKELGLAEWAIVTRFFGAERQLGLALHNGYEAPGARLEYELGVFSGPNARASHAIGVADAYGEKVGNPSDLASPAPRAELHPELVAHVAWLSAGMSPSTEADLEGGPARGSLGLSAAWDARPDRVREPALRLAAEAQLKARGLSLAGICYLASARSGDSISEMRLAFVGGLAQASWLARRRLELALRYAVVGIREGLRVDARARADRLVAAAAGEARKGLEAQYRNVGKVWLEQELTLGVAAQLWGRALRWQNDVSWLVHSRDAATLADVRLRSQLQLAL
jgi:hypothetical protein